MDTLTVQVWKLDFSQFKSPAAKLVALAIARRSRESGSCWAKMATLGEDCGVSKNTIVRCCDELVAAGWLAKVNRRRKDGSKTSDQLWLTLPETILNATTVDLKEHKRQVEDDADIIATVDSQEPTSEVIKDPPDASPEPSMGSQNTVTEGLKTNTSLGARDEPNSLEGQITTAVDLIWQKASKTGRERSSKADIAKALKAALGRGHGMQTILRGLAGYFDSADATKDDGAFQRGAHVMLASDRFLSFVDEPTKAAPTAGELGTSEHPAEKLQRHWMGLFAQGMPWSPERGPQPGRLGCRVVDAIQLEFGVQPFAQPVDAAAFD